ncbi:MAG TPA: hypothetical protein VGB64_08640 [Actinomycetota bacterium]
MMRPFPVFPVRRDDDGFVMIVAVLLLSIVASLGVVVMTSGNHSSLATGRGRSWVQSLHVAEAGVQDAMARMDSSGAIPANFSGSTDEGTYAVEITPLGRSRYRVEVLGTVAAGSSLKAARRVRVTLAPPESFNAALFSHTSVDTKNNDNVVGDIWANQNVIVDANDVIQGSVTAATGFVHMRGGSRVTKSVQSGGYNATTTNGIFLDNNARIDGDAISSVTAPTDPVTCGGESQNNFTIREQSGAVIGGNVTTWGARTGPGTVSGTISEHVCTAAPAAQPMPTYSYNVSNYDPATLHEWGTPSASSATALADFNTYLAANKSALAGTFTIFQTGTITQATRIDLSGVKTAGDVTLVTNLPVFTNGIEDLPSVTDAVVLVASFYQPPAGTVCDVNHDDSDCSIHAKNSFQTSGATAVLLYAPYGPVAIKNNQEMFGAVYADNIQIKNNQTLTYDARVDRIVGFGPVTLEPTDWMELPS